jgi:hypothetical protein
MASSFANVRTAESIASVTASVVSTIARCVSAPGFFASPAPASRKRRSCPAATRRTRPRTGKPPGALPRSCSSFANADASRGASRVAKSAGSIARSRASTSRAASRSTTTSRAS